MPIPPKPDELKPTALSWSRPRGMRCERYPGPGSIDVDAVRCWPARRRLLINGRR